MRVPIQQTMYCTLLPLERHRNHLSGEASGHQAPPRYLVLPLAAVYGTRLTRYLFGFAATGGRAWNLGLVASKVIDPCLLSKVNILFVVI